MSLPVGDLCPQCGHPFDPHVLVALGSPLEGGFIFCQDSECPCVGTWEPDESVETKAQEFLSLFHQTSSGLGGPSEPDGSGQTGGAG